MTTASCKNPANKNLFKSILLVLFLMTFLGINLFHLSCKRYDIDFQVRQIDSLIVIADKSMEILIVDASLVRMRIDSMSRRIVFLNGLDTARMSMELLYDVSQYKGLYVKYENFLSIYEPLMFDSKRLQLQTNELKTQLVDRKISKAEFEASLMPLRDNLYNHYDNCSKLVKEILSTEMMYQRINNKISEFHERKQAAE